MTDGKMVKLIRIPQYTFVGKEYTVNVRTPSVLSPPTIYSRLVNGQLCGFIDIRPDKTPRESSKIE